jgi:hypothetical protein
MRIEELDEIRSATAGLHAAVVAQVKATEGLLAVLEPETVTRCNTCGAPAKFLDHMQDGEEWQSCANCGTPSDLNDPDAVYEG